jgi:hypothetical protein
MLATDTGGIPRGAPAVVPNRMRVGIADRDSGFVQTLVKRLPGLAMEPLLVAAADPDALVSYLRSTRPVFLTRLGQRAGALAA